jgi:hypothetical protein
MLILPSVTNWIPAFAGLTSLDLVADHWPPISAW